MKWEIRNRPSYSILRVVLEPGEEVTAEPGAMVYMSSGIEVETRSGGVLKGLARKILGGESFFLNTFKARGEGEVWFAPSLPGDIEYVEVKPGEDLVVQDTSYLAHHGKIDVGVAWRGFRGLIAEGELFWLKLSGDGGAWVTSYGGIEKMELKPGEKAIVDNFHFVAMTAGMKWKVRKFGGLKTFLFGGEGLVVEVEGPGKLLIQTRSLPAFAQVISRYVGKHK